MQQGAAEALAPVTQAAAEAAAPLVQAAAPAPINTGDTAWVLVCSILVLMMSIPGLALFYGGLVRRKNVLSILMQCLAAACVISLFWHAIGYSLAFSPGNGFIGGLDWAFFKGVALDQAHPSYSVDGKNIPHAAFAIFQMHFAVITPAVVAGAFAERMRFPAFILFIILWTAAVYCPIAHWVWSDTGFMSVLNADVQKAGNAVYDFAGGAVIEVTCGISGLVCALVLGKRKGYPNHMSPPHNLPLAVTGACLLWIGWIGFNAGSALGANALAVNAVLVTQLATAAAGITWALLDAWFHGKPTVLGLISGVIAGLVAATPTAGYISPGAGILVGVVASALAWIFVIKLKNRFGYDDTLDVFGVHGIAGIVGTLGAGLFASSVINSFATQTGGTQVVNQMKGIAIIAVYAAVVTFVLLKLINFVSTLRASNHEETVGLDVTQHKESAYTIID
jgi:Amt family ammonium transporter